MLLTPFAPVGAGMIGSGYGVLAGGAIFEKMVGANIGSIVGGAVGGFAYGKLTAKAGSVELINRNDKFITYSLIRIKEKMLIQMACKI